MDIFNLNDYKKVDNIDFDELDNRYLNTNGDAMDTLYVKNISLYDPLSSSIAFADDTIQTTAFKPSMITELEDIISNTQVNQDIENLQQKTTALSYNINTTTISSHLNVVGNITQNGTDLLANITVNKNDITTLKTDVSSMKNITTAFSRTITPVDNLLALASSVKTFNVSNANVSMNYKNIDYIGNVLCRKYGITGTCGMSVSSSSTFRFDSSLFGDTVNGSNFTFRTIDGTGGSRNFVLSNINVDYDQRTITNCPTITKLITDVAQIKSDITNIINTPFAEKFVECDFYESTALIEGGKTANIGPIQWKNYATLGSPATKVFTVASTLGHVGILRMSIPNSTSDNWAVNLACSNFPFLYSDFVETIIIWTIPIFSQVDFIFTIGIASGETLANGIVLRTNSAMDFVVCVNGIEIIAPFSAGHRAGKWMSLSVLNTGTGNAKLTLKNLTDNIVETYNYTGGNLSPSAIISPWITLQNRSSSNWTKPLRYADIDYISLRYKASTRT